MPRHGGKEPAPLVPRTLSQRRWRPTIKQRKVIPPDKQSGTAGSFAGRHWADLVAISVQFSRPPLGRSQ
jgi:hypothetical protein